MGQSQRLEPRVPGESPVDRQVKQIMADVLDLSPEAVDAATRRDQVASWDSLNHINLVLALEQEFQVSFEISEIEAMVSYGQIMQVLTHKLQP
jgi:acyl carrier protein